MSAKKIKQLIEETQLPKCGSIGKYVTLSLLFILGAFFIPDCFINRHVTAEVFGIASIAIVLSILRLIYIKRIQLSLYHLIIICFTIIWVFAQCFGNWLPLQDQIHYLYFCILLIVLSNWKFSDNNIKKYYIIALVAALGISFWGIAQYFDITKSFYGNPPVTGSFDNPAGIGIFLASLFPFCLFYMQNESRYKKLGAICISIIIITTVILSQSRTALLAIIAISALELSVIIKLPKYIRTYKRTFIVIALAICFVMLFLIYYWKVDSANGRLFIWQISWDMFLNNWFFGSGAGAFQSEYMVYQAEFFKLNPQSEFVMLADNVTHPFNEYLKILIEYGILGFSIVIFYIALLFKQYKQYRFNNVVRPLFLSLIAIGVSALFSYPFKYPAIGVGLIINLAIINSLYSKKIYIKAKAILYPFKIVVLIFMSLMIYFTSNWIVAEFTWNKIAKSSLQGYGAINMPTYDKISRWLKYDGLFLYNYGAELNYIGRYAESNKITTQCSIIFNDTDVQLLFADNYLNLGSYNSTEQYLLLAFNMCPVRFKPLHELFLLYLGIGANDKAIYVGEKILSKPIKVQSHTIEHIKSDVRQKLTSLNNNSTH